MHSVERIKPVKNFKAKLNVSVFVASLINIPEYGNVSVPGNTESRAYNRISESKQTTNILSRLLAAEKFCTVDRTRAAAFAP